MSARDGPVAALLREVAVLLREALADPACTWTLGAYGAAATFRRAPGEPAHPPADGRLGLVTPRGALAFGDLSRVRPVAYETALGGDAWSHAVALCLPDGSSWDGSLWDETRPGVTEIGPDRDALRPQDRDLVLFDLGLGLPHARIGLRPTGPAALAALRAACGQAPLAVWPALAALPCHGVVQVPCGRAEAFAAKVPGEGEFGEGSFAHAPDGPRLHLFERLIGLRRRHAATAPIPAGLVPVAHLHPPHPVGPGGFDRDGHARFQARLDAFGDPALVALKRRILAGHEAAEPAATRAARAVIRVARAQRTLLAGLAPRTTPEAP